MLHSFTDVLKVVFLIPDLLNDCTFGSTEEEEQVLNETQYTV